MSLNKNQKAFHEPSRPPVVRKGYKILSPKPNKSVKVVMLSSALVESHSHYQDCVSYPCVGFDEGCAWCVRNIPFRVKFYGAACHYPSGETYLVEITVRAVETCPTLIMRKINLRGKFLELTRIGMNKNSPVVATLEECHFDKFLAKMPEPFDVVEAVLDMWGDPAEVKEIRLPKRGKDVLAALLPNVVDEEDEPRKRR